MHFTMTLKQTGYKLTNNRITLTFRKWDKGKWRFDKVPYTFHKHRQWHGTIRRITIKRDACGDYWICITTTYTDFRPLPTTGQSVGADFGMKDAYLTCLLYTSPSPRDRTRSRMPSSA